MDAPYSNRELKQMFNEQKEGSDTFHNSLMVRMDIFESNTSTALHEIKEQTTKTNGSVADIKLWRERINGALVASGVFMAFVVVPILAWSLYILVNIQTTVHQAVDEALSAYNITK